MSYYWGETDHHDFLHIQKYIGDLPQSVLYVKSALSVPGSGLELIVDGEFEPDNWQEIKRISLNNPATKEITLNNPQRYCDAQGILSMRFRWLNPFPQIDFDTYIYEIWSETQ